MINTAPNIPTVTAAVAGLGHAPDWIVLKVKHNRRNAYHPWQIEVLANTGPNHSQELRYWSVPSIFDDARYDLSRAVFVGEA